MNTFRRFLRRAASSTACGVALVALLDCGGAVTGIASSPDAGSGDGSPGTPNPGTPDPGPSPQCPGSPSQPVGRPQPTTCAATGYPQPAEDAGVPCTTLADCLDAGEPDYGPYKACLGGQCSYQQCLTDSDCPTGTACGCANQFGGNAIHTNTCVPSQCRVDSDCEGGVCSPSSGAYCGSLTGFYCHSAADTCETNADCCGGDGGEPEFMQCVYDTTLGHFACQAAMVCAG
jgi:hypothetical protein